MSSYMRVRGVDAMLVLRNENKWAMTGKYSDILFYNLFFLIFFRLILEFLSVILWCLSVLVADVEVKEDGVFIRLRKEGVVREDKDSDKEVPYSVSEPVVEEVSEIGAEVTVHLETIPEDF